MNHNSLTRTITKMFRLLFIAALAGQLVLSAGSVYVAHAASFTINSTADVVDANPGNGVCATASGICTLRAAIQEANALAGEDTITQPAGTYVLTIAGASEDAATTGDLDITSNLTINGAGAAITIINGNGNVTGDRVFHIIGSVTVTISGVTIQNGMAASFQNGSSVSFSGGGIANEFGTLMVTDATVANNSASLNGGGIDNFGSMSLSNVTISGNNAQSGGGIYNEYFVVGGGSMSLTNVTISGNNTSGAGAGVVNGTAGTMSLTNVTISGNNAGNSPGYGGGIYINSGSSVSLTNATISGNNVDIGGGIFEYDVLEAPVLQIKNTIVANNSGGNCEAYIITSLGHNLSSDNTCALTNTGDLVNTNPLLGPLLNYGGPTLTRALLPGSPAIDAGSPDCPPPATDQRGVVRPQSAACDIGAYEFNLFNQIFLPAVTRNYCPDFFDNFSNPASGWPVGEDTLVRYEYLNGEYRVLSKQAGYFYFFRAPTCDRQNYAVETDARWVGTPGDLYGLLFGITGNFSQLYIFDVNTDYRDYELLRLNANGTYTQIVPVTFSSAIHPGTATNHLKVTRNGNQITLEANGTVLGTWSDGTITGLTGVGLVSGPYNNLPTSDARFDNFTARGVSSSSKSTYQVSSGGEQLKMGKSTGRRLPLRAYWPQH
jgi:CSLREA domain-containing protein